MKPTSLSDINIPKYDKPLDSSPGSPGALLSVPDLNTSTESFYLSLDWIKSQYGKLKNFSPSIEK